MGLTNEHVGPKIVANIKIYVLTRAHLLFNLCYEIPCSPEQKVNDWIKNQTDGKIDKIIGIPYHSFIMQHIRSTA